MAFPPELMLIPLPADILLNCNVLSERCANNPVPVPKFVPSVVVLVILVFNSVKLLFTFINASRRSSPVPSFAILPILIAVSYTHLTLPTIYSV